ncbi:hypothetical protein Q0F99_10920 [Rathayibacter oskolensis]|nr:hypothetical protein [Rathayibacter oskolensis]WKK73417.1 hypothetical protein Q0F99_10920 [Rathayibacter oskolensis]
MPVVADADQLGVERDPGLGERPAVARLAQVRRLEVGAAAEQGDPAVAELDEVPDREHRASELVRTDRGQLGLGDQRPDHDEREVG